MIWPDVLYMYLLMKTIKINHQNRSINMDWSSHGSVMGYVMGTFGELLNCHIMGS